MDPEISINLETTISIKGEVIEILEKEGKAFAKITFYPGFLTIPLNDSSEVLLNDLIVANGKLIVKKVAVEVNKEDLPGIQFLNN